MSTVAVSPMVRVVANQMRSVEAVRSVCRDNAKKTAPAAARGIRTALVVKSVPTASVARTSQANARSTTCVLPTALVCRDNASRAEQAVAKTTQSVAMVWSVSAVSASHKAEVAHRPLIVAEAMPVCRNNVTNAVEAIVSVNLRKPAKSESAANHFADVSSPLVFS